MNRLPQGSDYLFISLRTLKIVPTHDCYFPTDDQRFEEGNYFTDGNVARACLSTIREEHGGELEGIEDAKERNKGKLIVTISHLVNKALGKPAKGKKSEDDEDDSEEEEKAPKKPVKVEPQDIVQDLVLAYGSYRDKNTELAEKEKKITAAIKDIIKEFTL